MIVEVKNNLKVRRSGKQFVVNSCSPVDDNAATSFFNFVEK
jgi:hypothetical protein